MYISHDHDCPHCHGTGLIETTRYGGMTRELICECVREPKDEVEGEYDLNPIPDGT